MVAASSPVERLQAELPSLDWITDPGRLARLSSDFSWFSPVLKRQLAGKRADISVRPRTESDIRDVVAACARHRVPLTIRGSGTGNYGQSTPLYGGVLLDMSGFDAALWVRSGAARAQAGLRLADLEAKTKESGQELRCYPSTFRSATVGGLFGGGFGGIGSINYGPLGAPGNVLGIRAMTIETEPQTVELRGAEALRMHHLWGTNGLVLEVELALAPAHRWIETLTTFADFDSALSFADALANAPGLVKREVAFFADPIPQLLKPLASAFAPGCHAVLSIAAEPGEDALRDLVASFGGAITYRQSAAEVEASGRTLIEYTWNHTTLHALKMDAGLTYLQSAFPAGSHVAKVREMERLLNSEVLMHTEFIRGMDGRMFCSGLQLVRFTTEARLTEIMTLHAAQGVMILNPHVNTIEEGRAQGAVSPDVLATKARFDPHGLLNPGKLRSVAVS